MLAPTPNLYQHEQSYPIIEIAPSLKTAAPDLLYMTDRKSELDDSGSLSYGSERSYSMAMGEVVVQFGTTNWQELLKVSGNQDRSGKVSISLATIEEKVRFPETPLPFTMIDGQTVIDSQERFAYQTAIETCQTILQKKLALSPGKEVLLFVHGFNNDFVESALSLTDVWHYSGRNMVPLFYSWPAASGGLFGYFKDRESGEFTIHHLKETLRMISQTPGLEKLHILAHSRGTDLVTSALRELIIESRAAGYNPREHLNIQNLILAAPDLDFGVVSQRIIAEQFGPAIGGITVYMNQTDKALGLSQFLMSGLRFGKLTDDDLQVNETKIFERLNNVNFINVEGVSRFLGHSYYRQHPGVLSDIALILNHNALPGTEFRPLINTSNNFWTLSTEYPSN